MTDGNFVIDMHHHYFPAEALKLVGKTKEHDYRVGVNRCKRAYEIMADIDAHLEFMDTAGIDLSILSTGAFSPNGYHFCKACNDGYSQAVKRHPKRFKGMIHIYPFDDKDKNEAEIKRAVEELGLWGLSLVSSYGETRIDSRLMDPLYEWAIKYDMPVFIHPTVRINLWGGERYELYMTMAREYDISKSFVEIFHGVLPRFPGLKVIMAHFGGGIPILKGRFLAWYQPENFAIPPEDRGHGISIYQTKEIGLFDDFESRTRNILFDSAGYGGWIPVIKSAFETLGPDHLCLGTDFPYELNKAKYAGMMITDIRRLEVKEEDKRKFFNENLRKSFNL